MLLYKYIISMHIYHIIYIK